MVFATVGASEAKCHADGLDSLEPAISEDGEGPLESGGGGGATSCGSVVVFDSLVCRDDRDLDRTWLESNLSRNIVVVFSSTSGYGSGRT